LSLKTKLYLFQFIFAVILLSFLAITYRIYIIQYQNDLQEYIDENVNLYKKQFLSSYKQASHFLLQNKNDFIRIHQQALKILIKDPNIDLDELVNHLQKEFHLNNISIDIFLIDENYVIYKTTYLKDLGLNLSYILDAKLYLDQVKRTDKIVLSDFISTDSLSMEYKIYSYSRWIQNRFLELGFTDKQIINSIKTLLGHYENVSTLVKVKLYSIIHHKKENIIESYPFKIRNEQKKNFYTNQSKFFIDLSKQKPTHVVKAYLKKDKVQIQKGNLIKVYVPLFQDDMYKKIGYTSLVLEVQIDISQKLKALHRYQTIFIIFVVVIIIFLIIVFLFIEKNFKLPMDIIISNIKKKEKIDYDVLLARKDELSLIANEYNKLFDSLQKEIAINKDLLEENKCFIADTVHQIRTPLSIIMMNNDLIKMFKKDSVLQEFLDQIDASINMLSNSYEDLAYLTSHDSIKYISTTLCLSDVLEERVDFFRSIAKANNKKIDATIQKGIMFNINQIELERLIDNNISNAIKYSKPTSTIQVTLVKNKEFVEMSFSSIGIRIRDPQKVFEKNYRENNSKHGLGLGLNMVKNIAQKYQIQYFVKYKEGQNIFIYLFKV